MFGLKIGTINFKNAFENALWLVLGALLGAFITYKVLIGTTDNIIEQMIPAIEKAIDKETIRNDILNKIEIKDNKFKKNDSLNININQEPVNNQKPENIIVKVEKVDSIPKKKKGFFGRLFGKKN